MNISSLWQSLNWVAIVLILYAVLEMGVSPLIICLLLFVRFVLRIIVQLIGGVVKIAFILLILWVLTLIF
jgi:hypothetical protein